LIGTHATGQLLKQPWIKKQAMAAMLFVVSGSIILVKQVHYPA